MTAAIQSTPPLRLPRRISIIGMGRVGAAIADAITRRDIATHLVLIDVVASRVASEALDLGDAIPFRNPVEISHSSRMDASANSDLVFITAGARQREGESRLALLGRNVAIMNSIIPTVVTHSPHAAIIIVSNPCDVMTYVAAQLAGPQHAARILGSGTNLDSARLVSAIAREARVASSEVQACIVGEHGDSSVAVWSIASINGLPLRAVSEDLESASVRESLLRDVRQAAGEIIKAKGYTATAVGESCADLAHSMLNGTVNVRPVSTCVPANTFSGIVEDIYFSVPVRLSETGVSGLYVPKLDEEELGLLRKSADVLLAAQREADVHLKKIGISLD